MMVWLPIVFAGVGAAVLLRLTHCFASCPEAAMEKTSHHPDQYALVMAGRYGFMAFVAIGSVLSLDPVIIAFVFAGLSALGLYDAWVYARADRKPMEHLKASALGALVVAVALWSEMTTG